MSKYQNFIGIDIGKFTFVVASHNNRRVHEYENSHFGFRSFIKDYKRDLSEALVVLETTGGYETKLLLTLCHKNYKVHRANTRKVKNFIRSYGNGAKTDALDAKALVRFGRERWERLELFKPASPEMYTLYELAQRRKDLKQVLVAEKNRLQSPRASDFVKKSCAAMIKSITQQISVMTKSIEEIVASDKSLSERLNVLKTIPGVGDITAQDLLALIPELGTLTRRQIASLAGVAPRANESGRYKGYRRTGHGRDTIKPILFLAAMAARRSHSPLKDFYERLIANGKKKMVALTALMRKIIVIANARLKALEADMAS